MIDEYQGNKGKALHTSLRRAAEYVRMSTEHQQYSTENQQAAIREYAVKNNIEIVRTYCDGGKSGVSIHGRKALKLLLADVESGQADFDIILVYDISRWGRFQNPDEGGYYEFICKALHGIQVEYCAEQFVNDGTIPSSLMKHVKRIMAGEYSRELSAKVFRGQCRLIELGFRQGGFAGFGLRRRLVDYAGTPKQLLARGEHKSIQTDRVILAHGPKNEVQTVRWMFHAYVDEGKTEKEIAQELNAQNVKTDLGGLSEN